MFTVWQTEEFQAWLDALRDFRAQVRIAARLRLAEAGNLGNWKPVAGEMSEMRVDVGPAIGFISPGAEVSSLSCSPEAINLRRRETLSAHNESSRNWSRNYE